jgi:hypothetical protein
MREERRSKIQNNENTIHLPSISCYDDIHQKEKETENSEAKLPTQRPREQEQSEQRQQKMLYE